ADRLADVRPATIGRDVAASNSDAPTSPAPRFADDAEAAGLSFVYDNGHSSRRVPPPPEAMGGGVGLLDFDRDGWLDVYVVQGGIFPPGQSESKNADR